MEPLIEKQAPTPSVESSFRTAVVNWDENLIKYLMERYDLEQCEKEYEFFLRRTSMNYMDIYVDSEFPLNFGFLGTYRNVVPSSRKDLRVYRRIFQEIIYQLIVSQYHDNKFTKEKLAIVRNIIAQIVVETDLNQDLMNLLDLIEKKKDEESEALIRALIEEHPRDQFAYSIIEYYEILNSDAMDLFFPSINGQTQPRVRRATGFIPINNPSPTITPSPNESESSSSSESIEESINERDDEFRTSIYENEAVTEEDDHQPTSDIPNVDMSFNYERSLAQDSMEDTVEDESQNLFEENGLEHEDKDLYNMDTEDMELGDKGIEDKDLYNMDTEEKYINERDIGDTVQQELGDMGNTVRNKTESGTENAYFEDRNKVTNMEKEDNKSGDTEPIFRESSSSESLSDDDGHKGEKRKTREWEPWRVEKANKLRKLFQTKTNQSEESDSESLKETGLDDERYENLRVMDVPKSPGNSRHLQSSDIGYDIEFSFEGPNVSPPRRMSSPFSKKKSPTLHKKKISRLPKKESSHFSETLQKKRVQSSSSSSTDLEEPEEPVRRKKPPLKKVSRPTKTRRLYWNEEETFTLLEGLDMFGKNWKAIYEANSQVWQPTRKLPTLKDKYKNLKKKWERNQNKN
eukprot:TRINITY_DN2319_c0_g1_i1.p1 TRINITY_DN2319_c0_g1~~TRINITY_DN2319_c0_g1_i1.p1  ORF type:complete len:631 (+),score=139.88 TRINITY_DN2319_c0_g1_i1:36-1928(+)